MEVVTLHNVKEYFTMLHDFNHMTSTYYNISDYDICTRTQKALDLFRLPSGDEYLSILANRCNLGFATHGKQMHA
jgi:hypothetical protein